MNLSLSRSVIAISAAIVLGMSLGGCVVEPAHRYYVGTAVTIAPPPPPREVVTVAPYPGYVWIGGYWRWGGERHVWVPGHWDAPRPGYRWVPHRWHHEHDGWHLEEGHWATHR